MSLSIVIILLKIFIFQSLADNESNIDCTNVESEKSGTADDDTVSVGCPPEYPTLTSCGVFMSSDEGPKRDGTYIKSNKCYAQNGKGGPGVWAAARCCKFPGTMKCRDETGTVSGDDELVAISCPSDYTLTGCTAHNVWSDFDGFFFGTITPDYWPTFNLFNQHDPTNPFAPIILPYNTDQNLVSTCSVQGSGSLTTGYARCCKNEHYPLDCKMRYGEPGTSSTVGCSTGYKIVGCSAWTMWDNQRCWDISGEECGAYSGNDNNVWAMAVCCRIIGDVTETPTAITSSPSQQPTASPTPKPTMPPICKPCDLEMCQQETPPQPIPMATVNVNMWENMRITMILFGFNIIFICVIIYLCYALNKKRKYNKVYDFDSQDMEIQSETN